jgi:hypothetical protein
LGFNYDHDDKGRLIEDYWEDEWPTVEKHFGQAKQLGATAHQEIPPAKIAGVVHCRHLRPGAAPRGVPRISLAADRRSVTSRRAGILSPPLAGKW